MRSGEKRRGRLWCSSQAAAPRKMSCGTSREKTWRTSKYRMVSRLYPSFPKQPPARFRNTFCAAGPRPFTNSEDLTMPFTTNQGARLYWDQEGQGDPLLLIMGLAYPSAAWYRTRPVLARHFR